MQSLRKTLPPVNALIMFEAVARHLSFTAAARELGVSQAAASQRVKALEGHLGVALFRRERPNIRLTPDGEVLASAVRAGIERISDAVRAIRRRERGNRLTVATLIAFSSFWLMPRLPRFHAAYPEIELRLVSSDSDLDWDGESIDVAIAFGQGPWPGYESHRLFGDEIVAVSRPNYLRHAFATREVAHLTHETLLHLDSTNATGVTWEQWFAKFGIMPDGELKGPHFNNYVIVVQAAVDGQGIAMGWRRLVEPLLRRGDLAQVTAARLVPEASFHLLVPRRLSEDAAVIAFRRWIAEEAEQDW